MPTPTLDTNITQSQGCSSLFFHDITPLWDPIEFPDGYDAELVSGGVAYDPDNIDTSKIYLDITKPNSTIVHIVIPGSAQHIDRIGGTGMITYQITAAALGYTSTITDGIYKFVYSITDTVTSNIYTATCYILVDCQVCCCLNRKLIDINLCTSCSEASRSKTIQNLYHIWMLKDRAKEALACHDLTSTQEITDFITAYCGISTCDSC